MTNVIEIINDLNYDVDHDMIFDQGFIKIDTDLHEDDLAEALEEILHIKQIHNDDFINLYLKAIHTDQTHIHEVYNFLYDLELIPSKSPINVPHDVLDYDLIIVTLRGLGGFATMFDLLGYKIVELYDTNAIVEKDVDMELLDDYIYGYNYYTVTLFQNNIQKETIHNAHIRTEDDLINYVSTMFDIPTDFKLVHNPLTSNKFKNIPLVSKSVKEYQFTQLNNQ